MTCAGFLQSFSLFKLRPSSSLLSESHAHISTTDPQNHAPTFMVFGHLLRSDVNHGMKQKIWLKCSNMTKVLLGWTVETCVCCEFSRCVSSWASPVAGSGGQLFRQQHRWAQVWNTVSCQQPLSKYSSDRVSCQLEPNPSGAQRIQTHREQKLQTEQITQQLQTKPRLAAEISVSSFRLVNKKHPGSVFFFFFLIALYLFASADLHL